MWTYTVLGIAFAFTESAHLQLLYRDITQVLMDPDTYLRKHHVLTYVEDATLLLLGCKDEDSKTKPFEVLTDYFESVQNGTHIVFREYNFISATPHNRKSFIATFWQTYSGVPECNEPMRTIELHSLLRLLCADFPLKETEKVSKALSAHNTTNSIISFTDFSYMFQVTFYFDYFLGHLESLFPSHLSGSFHRILHSQFSSTTAVVVPLPPPSTTDSHNHPATSNSAQAAAQTAASETLGRAVNSGIFLEAVLGLCQKIEEREPGQSYPSQEALREVLGGVEQLSFYDFVSKLSLSDQLIREIGALPFKT